MNDDKNVPWDMSRTQKCFGTNIFIFIYTIYFSGQLFILLKNEYDFGSRLYDNSNKY